MNARAQAIGGIRCGDIFHAKGSNGASLICYATKITEMIIEARTVTTQYLLYFDRQTGIGSLGDGQVVGAIDSTAPVPMDIHRALLGLDQKSRLETDEERLKLNDAERRALLFVADYYPANPLPQ